MPILSSKKELSFKWSWTDNNAYFKGERFDGDKKNISIGLGKGAALTIFNINILKFEVISR